MNERNSRWRPVVRCARWGVLLPALALLAGCSFSPEQAIVRQVLDLNQSWERLQIQEDTIQVLQTQPWGDDVIGLVAFQAVDDGGQLSDCLFYYQVTQSPLWVAGRGGGGCGPAGGMGEPLQLGSGQHAGVDEGSWSTTSGTAYDPDIVAVRVIWDDGQEQRADLIGGHFLVVRSGGGQYARVEALDDAGEVIDAQDQPEPAPGKQ